MKQIKSIQITRAYSNILKDEIVVYYDDSTRERILVDIDCEAETSAKPAQPVKQPVKSPKAK